MIKSLKNAKTATKNFDFDLKSLVVKDAGDECIIEGYANTSDKDRVGDVVMPSAFEKSLPTYLKNPVLLENHNWDKVAGVVLQAEITDKGLYVRAKISDTRQDLKTMIREGCLRTFSIGYNELDADYDDSTKTKYIKELELLEISVVSVPANTEAMFTRVDTQKQETEATPKSEPEKEQKHAEKKPVAPTASQLKEFIEAVKEAYGEELGDQTIIAICDIYNQNEEIMKLTKKQLIEALRGIKSAPAAAPAEEQKQDAGQTDSAAEPAAKQDDVMKEFMAKLDAIAQACAQILEGMKEMPEEEKPAEDEKPEEKPEDEEKSVDEMSEEEIEKALAEIDSELEALEDSEADSE